MKFNGITLITDRVLNLAEFYKSVFLIDAEGDEIVTRLRFNESSIDICSKQAMENLAPGSTSSIGHGGCTIDIEVMNVDEVFNRLQNNDVIFIKLPETYPWGRRSFWIKDIDGNIINIFSSTK